MRERLNAALADCYAVERELGRGGMATVWLARDLKHDRPVALKVLHAELAGAIGVVRFVREVRLTANLQHPNIVPVLDSGVLPATDGGPPLPWYAMPFIAGESLRARLDREQQLPVDEALRITREVAGALQTAHVRGIVHRDIKPENVILAGDSVYVVDFGIAKALMETGGEELTSTGFAIGTPAYMSPEQASASPIDARTDEYGLATMLYEMLAGEPPFTGPTAQAIVGRRFAEAPRGIRPVRPTVPVPVERAVLKALERVPADRYASVTAFVAALHGPAPADDSPARSGRGRRIAGIAALAGVLAAVLGGGSWALLRGHAGAAVPPARDSVTVALYRRGVREYDRRTPAGAAEAIRLFNAAVARDSSFGEAWTGLARTYVRAYERRFVYPGVARDSLLRLAVAAADRALTTDRNNTDAWLAQSLVSRILNASDLAPAIRAARHSLQLDSANAPAWHALGVSLEESGDVKGAVEAWRRSVRADPRYTQGLAFLSLGHYWHRQYDSAAVWADSSVAVDPNYVLGWATIGQVAIERGEFARATAAMEAARRLSTDVEVANALAVRAVAEARAGHTADARATMRDAETVAARYVPAPLHTAAWMAEGYASLHDVNHAVDWLGRYHPASDLHFQLHLRCDPAFDPIAHDRRFRALLTGPLAGTC